MLVRTWAPCAQTPILRVPLSREHLSVIGALTLEGKMYLHIHQDSVKGPLVVRFLRHLLVQFQQSSLE